MISERNVASSIALLSLGLSVVMGVAHADPAASRPTNDKLPDWAPQAPPNVIEDKFRVEVMLLGATLDTDLRVDPNLVTVGTKVRVEDDLGLEDTKLLPLAEVTLLPGDRHMIRLSGFGLRREASKIIDQQIIFDDQIYQPGERVDTTLNLTLIGLTYGYSIVKFQNAELQLTFGLQVAEVEANAVVRSRVVRDAETGVTPLPLAGFEGRYDFTPRWSLEARVQYLSIELDDIDGSVLDARAAVTWRKNPHLVFGLGYRRFGVEVESADADDPGLVDLQMNGPLLFMRASL